MNINAYNSFLTLIDHSNNFSEEFLLDIVSQINRINHYTDTGSMESNELIHIFGRYSSNAVQITKGSLSLGIGIYIKFSFINHSCYPNCILQFDGRKLIVRCISAVNTGDMITFNYLTDITPYLQRHDTLKNLYYFDCNCVLCQKDKLSTNLISVDVY